MHSVEKLQVSQPNEQPDYSADCNEEDIKEISQNLGNQQGILKYYKRGDYFLAGTTPGDASKQKGEQHEKRMVDEQGKAKQGALLGVFFPVLQNILGVLLFIRVPAITGESGIRDSFIIVLLCVFTTFLTVLSLSAIATNGRISTGGTYYIISRSLGAPIGTAVGFSFYLGTTIAGAMYILGAVESFIISTKLELAGSFQLSMRVYGTILLVVLITINLVGLQYVAKTGLVFLSIVLLSILSMYIGIFTQGARDAVTYKNGLPDIENKYRGGDGITGLSSKHWNNNWDSAYDKNSLFVLLSIYFPSVTGIMAGSNRSGDLADAGKSIPKGTLSAQLVTSVIYLSFPFLFGAVADRGTLQTEKYLIAAECSWPTKYLTIVAIILSSTGAGLQSLAGSPRILEAIANDDNLPCFKVFKGKLKRIILLTGFICFCAIMIGEINVITPLITMFFLVCYGFVNLCCLFLDIVSFPNWRPTWKFYHKIFSFIGFALCIFLMIAISWIYFLVAMAFAAILFTIVIYNKKLNDHYGDSIDAVRLSTAKSSLVGLIKSSKHVKNWIPIVLVIGDYDENKNHDEQLESKGSLFFLNTIKSDISFIVYGTYQEGNYTLEDMETLKSKEKKVQEWLEKEKLEVIPKTVLVQAKQEVPTTVGTNGCQKEKQFLLEGIKKSTHQGLLFLMQAAGLGGLEPNTIMMEFPQNFKAQPERAEKFVQMVSYGVRFGKAIITTMNDSEFAPKMEVIMDQEAAQEGKRVQQEVYKNSIDIWSFSYENGLLILMTYFLERSRYWKNCNINIYIVTLGDENPDQSKEEEQKRIKEKVEAFLFRYRLLSKKMKIFVEIIDFSQWKQVEGFMLTEGKKAQIEQNPEFRKAPVDPESNYGMNLNEDKTNTAPENNGTQKPERALSVMSQTQVSQLNNSIRSKSENADLIIMNLPEPVNQKTLDYMSYIQNMTLGLKRVLMIRNDKQECITEFT